MTSDEQLWAGFDCTLERIHYSSSDPTPVREAVPDEVLALRMMQSGDDESMEKNDPFYLKKLEAVRLHEHGIRLDAQVDIYEYDPFKTMRDRRLYNYDDVPEAFSQKIRIMVPPQSYFDALLDPDD